MSYQVLARKWRPRKFAELVGQEHVVRALTNALDTGRMHHAYLFTGTRGVGKTTIARIFAKSLNCERGQSADPCGECSVCTAVDEGRFVDLLEIDAASNTGVDDVREVIENAQYAPSRGRFKVYLVDEVHMLSKNAFNALLKTLEEPPPHVKFLLATTDPQKLPVTVLSRCLKFNLKRLLPEQIAGQMRHILGAESIDYEEPAIAELARAADGSLRDGLSLLDQAIAYGGGALHGGRRARHAGQRGARPGAGRARCAGRVATAQRLLTECDADRLVFAGFRRRARRSRRRAAPAAADPADSRLPAGRGRRRRGGRAGRWPGASRRKTCSCITRSPPPAGAIWRWRRMRAPGSRWRCCGCWRFVPVTRRRRHAPTRPRADRARPAGRAGGSAPAPHAGARRPSRARRRASAESPAASAPRSGDSAAEAAGTDARRPA